MTDPVSPPDCSSQADVALGRIRGVSENRVLGFRGIGSTSAVAIPASQTQERPTFRTPEAALRRGPRRRFGIRRRHHDLWAVLRGSEGDCVAPEWVQGEDWIEASIGCSWKKRIISPVASGPRGSVYEPSVLPPNQA
jgi:hypothetical protein